MDIASAFLYCWVQLITPGPSNFMSMYSAARYGFKGAKGYLFGTSTGFVVKLVLCGLLCLALTAIVPGLIPYLKWVGFAYMLYLAIKVLLSAKQAKEQPEQEETASSTFMSGILLQCLNIKSWVFMLTMFSVYTVPTAEPTKNMLLLGSTAVVMMIACTLIWALGGAAIKKAYRAHPVIFNIVMAGLLIYCAVTAIL